MPAYTAKDSPLKAPSLWSLEQGHLVRRVGAVEASWSLSGLTRMTLTRQANRYGADVRMAQLSFGTRKVGFSSQSWRGLGRPEDQTAAFSAFVRALAAEAAALAPAARFRIGGRASVPAGLYWTAALLAAAVATMIASAVSAGFFVIGLDWGARLLFALILLFAIAPWLPGPAAGAFDPLAVPEELAPPA